MVINGDTVSVVLLVFILIREVQHSRVTNSLLDRLMSRDFGNYKFVDQNKPKVRQQRSQALSDEQMALWEKKQENSLNDINSEIDQKLAEAKSHSERAGVK